MRCQFPLNFAKSLAGYPQSFTEYRGTVRLAEERKSKGSSSEADGPISGNRNDHVRMGLLVKGM